MNSSKIARALPNLMSFPVLLRNFDEREGTVEGSFLERGVFLP